MTSNLSALNSSSRESGWDQHINGVLSLLSYEDLAKLPNFLETKSYRNTAAKICIIAIQLLVVIIGALPLLIQKAVLYGLDSWWESSLRAEFRDIKRYDPRIQVCQMVESIKIIKNYSISDIRVERTPNLSKYPDLEHVKISCGKIVTPPLTTNLSMLKALNLSHNRLENGPDLSKNTSLESLDLSGNELFISPDLSSAKSLTSLNLSDNELREFPNLLNNNKLKVVNLSNNWLTEFDESIFSLSSNTTIYLVGNFFTKEQIDNATARVAEIRSRNPEIGPNLIFEQGDLNGDDHMITPFDSDSLFDVLRTWHRESKKAMTGIIAKANLPAISSTAKRFEPLLVMEKSKQLLLLSLLNRLRNTQDYRTAISKNIFIIRLNSILRLSVENPLFREKMLSLIDDENQRCGDRATLIFNDIDILSRFYEKELTRSEMKDLSIRSQIYEELKRIANSLNTRDKVETALYLILCLKHKFNLPITLSFMRYPKSAQINQAGIPKLIN